MKIKSPGIRILGSGSSLSKTSVTNFDLWPETSEWVENRLGISERRHIATEENLIDLIYEAALKALRQSNLEASKLDAIIVATSTPDLINPSMASVIHGKLEATPNCASYDIQAVCAGFVYALGQVAALASASDAKYFLVIGADQFSKITDFGDRNCVFFGDGAAALILEAKTEGDSFLAVELQAEGTGWEAFHTSNDQRTFKMNAGEVSKNATAKLPQSINRICSFVGVKVQDIDYFVTHQPSKPVLDSLEESLALTKGRLFRNLKFRGNTAGATIPLLFDEMKLLEFAKSGDLICFSAIGAGWVWGSAILKWE